MSCRVQQRACGGLGPGSPAICLKAEGCPHPRPHPPAPATAALRKLLVPRARLRGPCRTPPTCIPPRPATPLPALHAPPPPPQPAPAILSSAQPTRSISKRSWSSSNRKELRSEPAISKRPGRWPGPGAGDASQSWLSAMLICGGVCVSQRRIWRSAAWQGRGGAKEEGGMRRGLHCHGHVCVCATCLTASRLATGRYWRGPPSSCPPQQKGTYAFLRLCVCAYMPHKCRAAKEDNPSDRKSVV